VHNQWVILGPALCRKNLFDRLRICGICAKAINSLGCECDEMACIQGLRSRLHVIVSHRF
jgi:hypothetical protein